MLWPLSLRVHAVPGGIHAQEAAGGHLEGQQCYQVLGRGPVHTISRLQGSNCINNEILNLFTPDRLNSMTPTVYIWEWLHF